MPKKREDILYISGKQKNTFILRRYADLVEDKAFKPNLNKPAVYTRNHTHCYKIETPQGNLVLWSSKVYDTDRAKAKTLLEKVAKELKVEGEIIEYKQAKDLAVKVFESKIIANDYSLNELSKPIAFKDEKLLLYSQGVMHILSKLKIMLTADTPLRRDEIKLMHKLLNEVVNKL